MFRSILWMLMVITIPAFTQNKAAISTGKPYPVIDADTKVYFRKADKILAVKQEKNIVTLQKFDAENLAFEKIKTYDDFPKNFMQEKILQVKDSYYYIYSWWDDENEQLFAREIDFAAGQFKGPGKKILSISGKMAGVLGKTGFFTAGVYDKYNFFFSYDSSSMLVQYRMKPEKKRDNKNYDVIGVHVFNADLTEQWSGQVTMPYTEKKMNALDYSIDSKGNCYLVAKVFSDNSTDNRKRGGEQANYTIELLKITSPDGRITTTKFDLTDKFIHTLWMYENSGKDDMIGTGFYNSGRTPSSVDGIVLFRLKPDGSYTQVVTQPIPIDVLNLNAGRKAIRKNEKKEEANRAELEDMRFQETIIQQDGSMILVGEQQYTVTHTSYSGRGHGHSYTSYHYDNILVCKFTAAGNLVWMKKLPKRQRGSAGRGGMSYAYFKGSEGRHHFLTLDTERNKTLNTIDIPEQYYDGKGGFMVDFSVDDTTGEVTKTYAVDLRNVNRMEVYQFATSRVIAYADDTFIFEAYKKGKEDVLVKIQIRK